eukprot:TRINITY_DN41_c0_g1_i1.p1 TRINITY_DN41_c0_g1~~TRINITY_DN41_c0_g1_i1.p1  ORF type:complete len:249 (-),score=64.40 TRINITY_DN41_c0_g1_i1:200-946(-)
MRNSFDENIKALFFEPYESENIPKCTVPENDTEEEVDLIVEEEKDGSAEEAEEEIEKGKKKKMSTKAKTTSQDKATKKKWLADLAVFFGLKNLSETDLKNTAKSYSFVQSVSDLAYTVTVMDYYLQGLDRQAKWRPFQRDYTNRRLKYEADRRREIELDSPINNPGRGSLGVDNPNNAPTFANLSAGVSLTTPLTLNGDKAPSTATRTNISPTPNPIIQLTPSSNNTTTSTTTTNNAPAKRGRGRSKK